MSTDTPPQVFSLTLYTKNHHIVFECFELGTFNFLTKGTAREFLRFFSRESVSRIAPNSMTCIPERNYLFHISTLQSNLGIPFNLGVPLNASIPPNLGVPLNASIPPNLSVPLSTCTPFQISAVLVTNDKYPPRTAQILIKTAIRACLLKHSDKIFTEEGISKINSDINLDLDINLTKKPSEIDKILNIQISLEETRITLIESLDKILERGEKLDTIMAKSSDLSVASKKFLKQAEKTNKCCSIL